MIMNNFILFLKKARLLFVFTPILFFQICLQAQNTGSIRGKVVDIKNNSPLPFVNIGIKGTNIGTTSDSEGNFEISDISSGFYQLIASYIGYETYTSEEFKVNSSKIFYIELTMRQSNVALKEVSVKSSIFKRDNKNPISIKSIGIAEIENAPGANRDIARVIQNLPGVAAIPAVFRNDIFIRGGAGNEAKFYLDDIEIPNINHFATQGSSGGTNGILNADLMREVNFYSAAFPASKANALSAVFDFKQIDGNKEKLKFRTSVGASELSLTADGPMGKKTTFIASVRRSYLQLLFKLIGLPFLPTFNDYQVKVKTKINSKNQLSLISLGALDFNRLDTDMKNADELQQYIIDYLPEQKQWNYAVGLVWKYFQKTGYHSFIASRNMLLNKSYKYLNNKISNDFLQDYESTEIENKLRWENKHYLNNDIDLNIGIDLQYVKYTNKTFQKIFIQNTAKNINYESALSFFKYAGFLELEKKFFANKLKVGIGYRMLGNSYAKEMNNPLKYNSLQAKIAFSFLPKITINLHAGRFYQLPPYTVLGYRNNNGVLVNKKNKIGYIGATHFVTGLEFYPLPESLISIEGFYKIYDRYPFSINDSISLAHRTIDFGNIGDEALSPNSKGKAYGIEFLSQNRFAYDINFVMSYTFSVSKFLDKKNEYVSTAWDNRHIFIATLSKKFKHHWYCGIKWRFAGGLPYTPYDLEMSKKKEAWDIRNRAYLDYNQLMNQRLKYFHQLDIRINKSFFIKNYELKLYIDVQNVYNFKSQEQDIYTNKDKNGKIMTDPDDPTKYRLRTLTNDGLGTVLPTIGFIFDF